MLIQLLILLLVVLDTTDTSKMGTKCPRMDYPEHQQASTELALMSKREDFSEDFWIEVEVEVG